MQKKSLQMWLGEPLTVLIPSLFAFLHHCPCDRREIELIPSFFYILSTKLMLFLLLGSLLQ